MKKRLEGKIALVTGGSRGIGRAIVEKLAADGAAFIAVHYAGNGSAADEVVAKIKAMGVNAVALKADFSLAGTTEIDKLWQDFSHAVSQETGQIKLDILVNSAGVLIDKTFMQDTLDIYEKTMAINVKAPFFLTQAAAPYLRSGGRIINLSTTLTRIADPERSIYSMSKGAINVMTLALAKQFGPLNITVNAIAPGVTDTDMNQGWLAIPELRAQAEQLSVFARVGQAADMADLVAFLASDESRWVTGQVIDASGGTYI